ncbi:fungal-specific transcription factor domain-containing protein [Mycena haematopus]|nr:fungal-specific transcription factor domain-containing protein [Mycena haematopus]
MTSLSFQILSNQEIIDMKRNRGIVRWRAQSVNEGSSNAIRTFLVVHVYAEEEQIYAPQGTWAPSDEDGGNIFRAIQDMDLIFFRITRSEYPNWGTRNTGDRIRHTATHAPDKESPSPKREGLSAVNRSKKLRVRSKECSPPSLTETLHPMCSSDPRPSLQDTTCCDRTKSTSVHDPIILDNGLAPSWETLSAEILLNQLPDELRAWDLYDVYIADASWYATPIMPDELHELIERVYNRVSDIYDISPHALAVVFFAFSLASLADLSLSAYNSQADTFFDLGCTALTLKSIYGSTDLHTIQALVLAGLYYATGGARYSPNVSWELTSLAAGLCHTLGLHRETDHTRFDTGTAQRRRALFWEVYTLDTYQSLSFGRHPTIPLADIDCKFPTDVKQLIDGEGRMPEFFHTKWAFTREVTAPMAEVYTRATPPTYYEVADFDQRLRPFLECAPFPCSYDERTFFDYMCAHFIPRFAGTLLVYIHRASFIQVLQDWPLSPFDSPHAASFLAAFRGASMVIQSDTRSFSLYPEHLYRWWPIWSSLVNASFILGSIITKSPTSELTSIAFANLLTAVELVDHGAMHSSLAESCLPLLCRLRNKAAEVYCAFHPLHIPLHPFELADDEDIEIPWGMEPCLNSDSAPSTLHVGGIAVPSLIPGLMPPPCAPELRAFMENAPAASSACGAYLAAIGQGQCQDQTWTG